MAFLLLLPHLLASLLILLPISAVAQNNGEITVGSSLTATDNSSSWLSPSGDFAFGFRPLSDKNDLFLLSIWFAKIPDKTIVWYATGDTPAPRGSKVELTADEGLLLTSPQGEQLWKPDTLIGTVAYGVMNNTGNFALQDSSFNTIWESFRNPTDTLLPTQTMELGGVVSSRQSETSFSKGRFQLRLQQDGNLVLNTINLPTTFANEAYYKSDTVADSASNSSSPGRQLQFNESGYIYILRENDQIFPLSLGKVGSADDFYFRATLDFDGVFTLYSHPRNSSGNQSWFPLWSVPDNICHSPEVTAGSGVCGYNSICSIKADRRPACTCPTGYSLLDPSDRYGSCKPDFIQGCEEDKLSSSSPTADLYDFQVLLDTDWPLNDYVLLNPSTEELCRKSCMEDCMCAVAIFKLGGYCWKKRLPLSNGRVVVDSNHRGKALIKIRKDNNFTLPDPRLPIPEPNKKDPRLPIPEPKKKDQDTLTLIGSVLLGGSVFVNVIFIGFSFIYRKKFQKIIPNGSDVSTNLRCFTYGELVEATNGFKEELGKGAFGVVYKGVIQTGSTALVAVKKLNNSFQETEREFKNEVNVIGQTHHKNLVRLLGFCDEGPNRLLVYEFLSNGTLADFLFGDLKPCWDQRNQIAMGIGRGLLYLHEECITPIIHCDIKPQNILLDDYYNVRISDFGLAKLLRMDQSRTLTNIRGTKGYVAPEWFRNMMITSKVDVYSYGVMLLEIICCRRSVDMDTSEEEKAILTDWAYDCYREANLDVLVEFDGQALDDRKTLERLVMVAIWCIQEDPSLRPTMRRVIQMLEGVVEVLIPPCPFPFSK
jgi:hypothetical protein